LLFHRAPRPSPSVATNASHPTAAAARADRTPRQLRAHPPSDRRAPVALSGLLSAFFINDTLCLVLTPLAIAAGAVMLAVAARDPAEALAKVEWPLLLFFAALFVVMRGVRDLPLVTSLAGSAASQLTGEPWPDATVVSAAMLVLSNLVSNVPAVILWLPVLPRLAHAEFVWLAMAMSSTFGGNLTILGSMANLIVAERAKTRGENISFWADARVGIP